tara:strand:+ start:1147 stop:1440 length:294 start_codon:yes stop_codon:yes gene_type:complete
MATDRYDHEDKELMEEIAQFQQDQMDAEMFKAWQECNPKDYKAWDEQGRILDPQGNPKWFKGKEGRELVKVLNELEKEHKAVLMKSSLHLLKKMNER